MLVPLAQADCLVVREPYAPAAAAGSRCAIVKLGVLSDRDGLFTSN